MFVARSNLAGKVAWITGASSGIGEALAYALAARGAALALSARREEALANVRSKCANPEQHFVLPLDLLRPDSFAASADAVLSRYGRIDLLIHCACISQRGAALDTELKVDRHLMELNYF